MKGTPVKRSLALLPVLALLLAGCASGTESEPTASPSPSETVAEVEAKDMTAEVKKAAADAGEVIVKAEETEPGRISVETSLVDPKGTDGSAEAQTAIQICEATAALDGVTYVSVLEKDGTSFVLFGHPAVAEGECAEV